nr:hypothetical protein [Chitinophagaceae bacterium]
MAPAEIAVTSNAVILKIHAITGWEIPEKMIARILKEQFIKKMQEGYATVNVDEIEYAFRTYGTQVKDWGKSMNLSLIDEVMTPYLLSRQEVSKMEEQKKPLMIDHKEDLSDIAMQDWYEDTAQKHKAGGKLEFLPPMIYD